MVAATGCACSRAALSELEAPRFSSSVALTTTTTTKKKSRINAGAVSRVNPLARPQCPKQAAAINARIWRTLQSQCAPHCVRTHFSLRLLCRPLHAFSAGARRLFLRTRATTGLVSSRCSACVIRSTAALTVVLRAERTLRVNLYTTYRSVNLGACG